MPHESKYEDESEVSKKPGAGKKAPAAPGDKMPLGGDGSALGGDGSALGGDVAGKLRPVADAADAALLEAGLAEPEAELAGPVAGKAEEPVAGAEAASPLEEKLGVDSEMAGAMLEVAKKFAALKALDASALADRLSQDFKMRMRVETEAAGLLDKRAAEAGEALPKPGEALPKPGEEAV